MLQWLEWYELPALWVAEYEKAAGRGVEPRERLKETYDGLKQGLSFDEIQEIHDAKFRMDH
jgi:hypothetical protein